MVTSDTSWELWVRVI